MSLMQGHVDRAMRWATENGYSFIDWSPMDIAIDLVAFDADIGTATAEELVPFTRDWKRRNPTQ